MSEPEPPRRRAWPIGLLLAIAQNVLVPALLEGVAVQTSQWILFAVVALLGAELIVGLVLRGGYYDFLGRVLVFAALFPAVLVAVLLLALGGICILQRRIPG